jgi:uncharacterized protein YkwD
MDRLFKLQLILFILISIFLGSCKKEDYRLEGGVQLDLLDSVNNLRLQGCLCGPDTMPPVKALTWNDALAKAAEAHAKDMYEKKYFDHNSPSGSFPIQRAIEAGYQGNTVGENIGRGYTNSATVMAAWKASENHCRAMMEPIYVEMGAYSYGGYWVQEFGK